MAPGRNSDVLATAADRLTARYGEVIAVDTIRRVLDETYQSLLTKSTITTYLPVLAERSAAARLAAAANSQIDPQSHTRPMDA
jgi:hypothetical protein